ncbi:hypothetical protein V6Z88_003733 [Aspergillus fumigatus]
MLLWAFYRVVDIEWVSPDQLNYLGLLPGGFSLTALNDEWDVEEGEAPKARDRYFKCLEICIHVLEEEEIGMAENGPKELSELVRWSRDTGAMWLHMLLSSGSFDMLT